MLIKVVHEGGNLIYILSYIIIVRDYVAPVSHPISVLVMHTHPDSLVCLYVVSS